MNISIVFLELKWLKWNCAKVRWFIGRRNDYKIKFRFRFHSFKKCLEIIFGDASMQMTSSNNLNSAHFKSGLEFLVLNEIIAEGARNTWRECEPWCQIRQHVKVIINLKLRQLLHAALVARIYRLSPLKSCYFLHRSSLEAKNTSCFECQMGQRGNLHVKISLATISLPTIIKTVNMSGMM